MLEEKEFSCPDKSAERGLDGQRVAIVALASCLAVTSVWLYVRPVVVETVEADELDTWPEEYEEPAPILLTKRRLSVRALDGRRL